MPLGQQMRIRSSQKNILNVNLRKISAFMTHGQFPLKIAQILTLSIGMRVRDGHVTTVQGQICPGPCLIGLNCGPVCEQKPWKN